MSYPLRYQAALRRYAAQGSAEDQADFKVWTSGFTKKDRWGGPGVDDPLRRLAFSDWLRDRGREEEADLLADSDQHVIFLQGKVHPAEFDPTLMLQAVRQIAAHVHNWSEGQLDPFATHADSTVETEPDGEGIEPTPHQHARVWRTDSDGWVGDVDDEDLNQFVHLTDLPNYLADHVAFELDPDYGWNTDYADAPPPGATGNDTNSTYLDKLLDQLRNVPIERRKKPKTLREAPAEVSEDL